MWEKINMLEHIQMLLYNQSRQKFRDDDIERGDMDDAITSDESLKASSVLKASKAPGHDNVLNEMI